MKHQILLLVDLQTEYDQLSQQCSEFAVALLDQCRNTEEVKMLLNRKEGGEHLNNGQKQKFSRVAVAVDSRQKAVSR